MSHFSKLTIEKRQTISLLVKEEQKSIRRGHIGVGATSGEAAMAASPSSASGVNTQRSAAGDINITELYSARSTDGSELLQPDRHDVMPQVGRVCGCEAFAGGRAPSDMVHSDGAFPAFLQTACVVSYGVPALIPEDTVLTGNETKAAAATPRTPKKAMATPKKADSPAAATAGNTSFRAGAVPASPSLDIIKRTRPRPARDDPYDEEIDHAEDREARRKAREGDHPVGEEMEQLQPEPTMEPLSNNVSVCDRLEVKEVWTAEADSSISVRDPTTGRHCKGQPQCSGFGGVFATCLLQARGLVFAGYQDGYVRAFDAATKELVFEKKKHAGQVNAFAQWRNNILFSAADDFRIIFWKIGAQLADDEKLQQQRYDKSLKANDKQSLAPPAAPVTEPPSYMFQLHGHSGRVQSLHVEGDFLYSGGDDGWVKCWDIMAKTEVIVPGRFPLLARPGLGIKDMCFCQDVAVTAGKGGVDLWDLNTCTLMRQFPFPDVSRISVDPASLVLWVCCSTDGTVTLIDLYTYEEIGKIDDFSNENIKSVLKVCNSAASRVFLGVRGKGASVAYIEATSTGMRASYEPVNSDTRKRFHTLDDLREEALTNEKILKEYRALLWSIRGTDQYHKHCGVRIFSQDKSYEALTTHFQRCLLYIMKARQAARFGMLAGKLEKSNQHRLCFSAWLRWYQFRRRCRDARFKDVVTDSMKAEFETNLVARQLKNALLYLAHAQEAKRNDILASILYSHHDQERRLWSYITLRRFAERAKRQRKRYELLSIMGKNVMAGFMRRFFRLWGCFAKLNAKEGARQLGALSLEQSNSNLMLERYYRTWRSLMIRRETRKQAEVMARGHAEHGEHTMHRTAFSWLLQYAVNRKRIRREMEVANLTKKMEEMVNMVENTPVEEESELDATIERLKDEVKRAEQEAAILEDNVRELENNEQRLMALSGDDKAAVTSGTTTGRLSPRRPAVATATTGEGGAEGEAVPAKMLYVKLDEAIQSIRPKVLNIPVNIKTIKGYTAAKMDKTKPPPNYADAFADTIDTTRFQMQVYAAPDKVPFSPDEDWPVDRGMIQQATLPTLRKSLMGVRESVVVWDYIRMKPFANGVQPNGYILGGDEFLSNFDSIKAVVDAEYAATVLSNDSRFASPKRSVKRSRSKSKSPKKAKSKEPVSPEASPKKKVKKIVKKKVVKAKKAPMPELDEVPLFVEEPVGETLPEKDQEVTVPMLAIPVDKQETPKEKEPTPKAKPPTPEAKPVTEEAKPVIVEEPKAPAPKPPEDEKVDGACCLCNKPQPKKESAAAPQPKKESAAAPQPKKAAAKQSAAPQPKKGAAQPKKAVAQPKKAAPQPKKAAPQPKSSTTTEFL